MSDVTLKPAESLRFSRVFLWMTMVIGVFSLALYAGFLRGPELVLVLIAVGMQVLSFLFGLLYQLQAVSLADRGKRISGYWMLLVQVIVGFVGFVMAILTFFLSQ